MVSFSFEAGTNQGQKEARKQHKVKNTSLLEDEALNSHFFLAEKKEIKLSTEMIEEDETRSVTARETKTLLQGDL